MAAECMLNWFAQRLQKGLDVRAKEEEPSGRAGGRMLKLTSIPSLPPHTTLDSATTTTHPTRLLTALAALPDLSASH